MTYKLIYLATRNPNLRRDEFPEAWRSHSRLASRFSATLGKHFSRVMQCIKIHDAELPREYANTHDGAAILSMKSWEDLVQGRSHPDAMKTMKEDEPRVFAGYVANWTMAAKETAYFEKSEGKNALIHFVARRPDVTEAQFMSVLSGRYAERILALPVTRDTACRLAFNEVIEAPDAPYDFAAVTEMWFEDEAAAKAAAWDNALLAAQNQLDDVADIAGNVAILVRINFEKIPGEPQAPAAVNSA